MGFSRAALALVAAAAVIGLAAAGCPNGCSGHGDCGASDLCTCWDNYMGADCSRRVCPYDRAFTDVASDINTAHNYAECSNAGVCDRETGECQCREGYTGRACERVTCMNDCSGHGVCRTLSELAQNGLPQIGGNETSYYQLWDGAKIQGCVCDAGYEGVDCSQRACPRGDDPLTTGQASWVNTVALRGRFQGEFSLVVVDSYGTEWTTRPLRAGRDIDDGEQVVASVTITAGVSTDLAGNDLGATAGARNLAVGDIVRQANVGGGATDLYVTAVDYATPTFTLSDLSVGAAAGALTRRFGGATAAQVESALEELPNRVIQDVVVTLDSTVDGAIANVATAAAHRGISYLVTFNSPAKIAHALQVDACACTSAGCSPYKLGVSFDGADGVFTVADGAVTNTLTVAAGGTDTGAEWTTAFGSKCDTTRHVVPTGLYFLEQESTTVARIRDGMSGDWQYVAFTDSETLTMFDGIQVTNGGTATGDDSFVVVAPFGIESWWSAGAKEDAVCSNRGLCDYETGICQCFSCATGLACETQTTLT